MYLSVKSFNPCISVIQTNCPYVNGTAVYKARIIYASINPGIDYNDLTICNSAGVYKNGVGKGLFDDESTFLNGMMNGNNNQINYQIPLSSVSNIILYPNPAYNYFTIEYRLNEHENAVLKIFDVLGRERMEVDLNASSNKVLVKTDILESGIYTYKYSVNNLQNSTGKLIIK